MIALKRGRGKYIVDGELKHRIPSGLRGRSLVVKNRELLEQKQQLGDLASGDFKKSYWKPAKDALSAETFGKCAYCEASVKDVAYGDVEHYRPKSKYWWLAYCYDNYMFACTICNQVHKSDHFPVDGQMLAGPPVDGRTPVQELDQLAAILCPDPVAVSSGYTLADYTGDCLGERPQLLNPYMDDPELVIAWQAIPALKEVLMAPVDGSGFAARAVAAMVEYYGLNREELSRLRWDYYEMLDVIRLSYQDPNLSQANRDNCARVLRDAMLPDHIYAGMVRYFVNREWGLGL